MALHHFLERSGYRVAVSNNVSSSLRAVFRHSADLVILDLGLTDGGSSEVLTKIRRRSTIPVIVCSDRASEGDRIRMLNLGADDFVAKPYSFAELEARVRAVLRRGTSAPSTTIDHGELAREVGALPARASVAEWEEEVRANCERGWPADWIERKYIPPDWKKVYPRLGGPPVWSTEDIEAYTELLNGFTEMLEPRDMIELMWTKEAADASWEVARIAREKNGLPELLSS